MWARTQLKIGWCDLMYGAAACFGGGRRDVAQRAVESYWTADDDTIASYSVRSGFDLLLQALDFEPGSEVIFSALNVKGMVKIVSRLGLTPVPADLDIAHFGPTIEALEAAVSPNSKMLIIAHLFGTVLDMAPYVAFARKHDLILVEDCAQVFDGHGYLGSEDADVRLFSFGPLKTATALGGALVRVKEAGLRVKMRSLQAAYPLQTNANQLSRVVKFGALKLVTSRLGMRAIYRGFRLFGRDYQDALSDKVRGVAKLGSSKQLRYQPATALLKLMNRRLQAHAQGALNARSAQGRLLTRKIGDAVVLPGQANRVHSYWVFPLIVDQPAAFIRGLRARGFDCADLPRSQAVPPPDGRPGLEAVTAAQALADMVIVPCYPGMPEAELERLAAEIKKIAGESGSARTKGYAGAGVAARAVAMPAR